MVDETPTILVADLTGDMSGAPPVVKVIENVPDAAALAAVAADPNLFAFNERFPGGFTPQFGGTLADVSLAVGIRGELDNSWLYDLSAVFGRNNVEFYMENTINPPTGHPTKQHPHPIRTRHLHRDRSRRQYRPLQAI